MKLAVFGSRSYKNYGYVRKILDEIYDVEPIEEIVSGGAAGVDSAARRYAKELEIPCAIYYPDYTQHQKAAPLVRNTQIAEHADSGVCFWDGDSRGTLDTLRKLVKRNKFVAVYPCDNKQHKKPDG